MNLDAAAELAHDLLVEHELAGWSFAFNRRKRAMGLCRYDRRRIELSVHFVQANSEQRIRDTLLHEIAHALAGPQAGHGPVWRRICRRIGAVPRASGPACMPAGRWQAQCPSCRAFIHRHRRPSPRHRYHCRQCGPQRGKIVFHRAAGPPPSAGRPDDSPNPGPRDML